MLVASAAGIDLDLFAVVDIAAVEFVAVLLEAAGTDAADIVAVEPAADIVAEAVVHFADSYCAG